MLLGAFLRGGHGDSGGAPLTPWLEEDEEAEYDNDRTAPEPGQGVSDITFSTDEEHTAEVRIQRGGHIQIDIRPKNAEIRSHGHFAFEHSDKVHLPEDAPRGHRHHLAPSRSYARPRPAFSALETEPSSGDTSIGSKEDDSQASSNKLKATLEFANSASGYLLLFFMGFASILLLSLSCCIMRALYVRHKKKKLKKELNVDADISTTERGRDEEKDEDLDDQDVIDVEESEDDERRINLQIVEEAERVTQQIDEAKAKEEKSEAEPPVLSAEEKLALSTRAARRRVQGLMKAEEGDGTPLKTEKPHKPADELAWAATYGVKAKKEKAEKLRRKKSEKKKEKKNAGKAAKQEVATEEATSGKGIFSSLIDAITGDPEYDSEKEKHKKRRQKMIEHEAARREKGKGRKQRLAQSASRSSQKVIRLPSKPV